jgi:hypothetical protein
MPKNGSIVKRALQNQMKGESREVIDWLFYDSVLTTVSVNQTLTLFQNTIGTAGIARTNMKAAGQLPSPQSFLVTEIGMKLFNTAGTPMFFAGGAAPTIHPANVIFGGMTWKIKVEPSTEYEGHGSQFWSELDYMNDTGTTLGVQTYPQEGFKSVKLKVPLLLISNRAFSVEVNFTAPAAAQGYTAAGTPLYCFLKGILRRNS